MTLIHDVHPNIEMPGKFTPTEICCMIAITIIVIANLFLACGIGLFLPKYFKEEGWQYIGDLGEMSLETKMEFCRCKKRNVEGGTDTSKGVNPTSIRPTTSTSKGTSTSTSTTTTKKPPEVTTIKVEPPQTEKPIIIETTQAPQHSASEGRLIDAKKTDENYSKENLVTKNTDLTTRSLDSTKTEGINEISGIPSPTSSIASTVTSVAPTTSSIASVTSTMASTTSATASTTSSEASTKSSETSTWTTVTTTTSSPPSTMSTIASVTSTIDSTTSPTTSATSSEASTKSSESSTLTTVTTTTSSTPSATSTIASTTSTIASTTSTIASTTSTIASTTSTTASVPSTSASTTSTIASSTSTIASTTSGIPTTTKYKPRKGFSSKIILARDLKNHFEANL